MDRLAESDGRPRRILVTLFFWRSLELEGGAGLVAAIVRSFERRGHEVTLLVPGTPPPDASERRIVSFQARTVVGTMVRYARRLRALAREVDGLVLIENSPMSHLLAGPLVSARMPVAVHVSSPAVGVEILRAGLRRQYLAHLVGKSRAVAWVLARIFGFRFRYYAVSTEHQRRELVRLGCPAEAVEVVPYGVDRESFVPAPRRPPEAGRLTVGYLGHFAPVKGVADLVEAFDLLAAERPGARLRIAWSGKGGEARRVRRRIEASPHRDRIEMEGRVDVPSFLGGLDVMVLPFRAASIPHLPLVLLESFAMGVPVVTTRVGGLAEAARDGETGFAVAPGKPGELAAALRRLCDEPDLLERLRAGALEESRRQRGAEHLCDVLLAALADAG